jgi:AraC-like DNA-binding protein
MFEVLRHPASKMLAPFVRHFEERSDDFGARTIIRPLTARYAQNIEFYLADCGWFRDLESSALVSLPMAIAAGPLTRRKYDLLLSGHLHKFTIQFTPTGFHSLFRVPLFHLTDDALALDEIASRPAIGNLWHRLRDASAFTERVVIAEKWLMKLARDAKLGPIASAADSLSSQRGAAAVRELAANAGMSVRQFERRFITEVGVTPKLYARILRFRHALDRKPSHGAWAGIAQDAGYFDQAHLIRDFRDFAGAPPARYAKQAAPSIETVIRVGRMS